MEIMLNFNISSFFNFFYCMHIKNIFFIIQGPVLCAAKVKVRISQDKRTQTLRPSQIQWSRSVVPGKWSCEDSRRDQTFCEEMSISDTQVTLHGDGLRLHAWASSRRLKAVVDDQKASQGTTVTQVVRKSRWKKNYHHYQELSRNCP